MEKKVAIVKIYVAIIKVIRKKERQDEIQFKVNRPITDRLPMIEHFDKSFSIVFHFE